MLIKNMTTRLLTVILLSTQLFVNAEQASDKPVFHASSYAPPHLSPEWAEFYATYQPFWDIPESTDKESYRKLDEGKQAWMVARYPTILSDYGVTTREHRMNGVRVVEIVPKRLRNPQHALMYIHGGGWFAFSPESTFIDTVPLADTLGIRVFAVDYQKVPAVSIYNIIDENVAVFQHLVKQERLQPASIGVFGCSAGGHLSLAVPNALRNRGMGLPGAAVAASPMVDFTLTNDTWVTLEGWDPLISREAYVRRLLPALGIKNPRDPVISPQYDDLSQGMPPTLIQTGGKEVLLSDSLVIFQALESAGQIAKLDVYDGLPHCFPMIFPDSKEAKAAFNKQANWFKSHLNLK